jgi:hypothetical protein
MAALGIAQTVHILPVAREIDRAVLPFMPAADRPPILHAHRILLVHADLEASKRVADKIERTLRRLAIVERHSLEARKATPETDFEQVLGRLAQLCVRELGAGHNVHINLSSGTKLFALAAGLAGMAHIPAGRGSLYYVRPAGYLVSESEFEEHGLSKGMIDVEQVQLMPLLLPTTLQRRVLVFLQARPRRVAEYRELVQFLSAIPGAGYALPSPKSQRRVRAWNNAVTTRMVRNVLAPLGSQGLLEIQEQGRQRSARLTRRGSLYACLVGLRATELRSPV